MSARKPAKATWANTPAAAPTATAMASTVYLWSSSQRALANDAAPALSRLLLLAAKHQPRPPLPERAAQNCCASCFSLIIPGVSGSSVRVRQHPHRAAARRRTLAIQCGQCGHVSHVPTAARPPARSSIAEAPAAAAPPPTGKGKKRAAPPPPRKQDKKARASGSSSKRPAASVPSPAKSDGLFGFDFVPL